MNDCTICGGTGFKIVTRGGVEGAARCECRLPAIAKAMENRAAIPKLYAECRLDNFQAAHALPDSVLFTGMALAVLACEAYVNEPLPAEHPGILLQGPCGTGKTHLAVGMLRKVIGRGVPGIFLDCGNMLEQVKESFGTGFKAECYRSAMDNDIALLDDLGAQTSSEWVKDTISAVITHRYNERKPTIITTNLKADEFVERLGERTASRLHGMCRFIQIPAGAKDFRGEKPRRKGKP